MSDYEDGKDGDDKPSAYGDLTRKIKAWIREDMRHVSKWRECAREDFRFYAGDTWSAEDKALLREQGRPEIEWNRVGTYVNAVVGSEINNRREVRFFPREVGDAIPNEILSDAGEWFRDQSNAEDEESEAFQSTVISGMGWTDTRLDFENNPDGEPLIECMDSLEMGWDCYAVKPNLEDARRMWRFREMSVEDAADLTGVDDKYKLNAAWVRVLNDHKDGNDTHDQDEADQYTGTQNEFVEGGTYKKKTVLLGEVRWIERETYWRGEDVEQPGQIRNYTEEQLELARRVNPDLRAIKQRRKVVRRAFIGSEVLGEPDTPMVPEGTGQMGWECITGYRDKIENQWYGIVRAMKDPQRWSNKFFSQVMFILNSQSQGGLIMESDALDGSVEDFEESWTDASAISVVAPGALSKKKVEPKPQAQFPAGFFTLFQTANEAFTDATGLSPEFLGIREVDQAGVLEYQRRQSSLNILAGLFNSLRRYRKRQGRLMLYLIQKHLADGRLIRIVGKGKEEYVPLTRDQVANVEYDIIVDDSPSSPNEKDRTWQILMQMLPLVKDFMDLDSLIEILEYSPVPASIVAKIKEKYETAKEQQQNQPSPEEQQMQMEMQMRQAEHQMDMAGKQADLQAKQAGAAIDLQAKQADLAIKQQGAQADMESKAVDAFIARIEAMNDLEIQKEKQRLEWEKLAVQQQQNRIARQKANAATTNAAR